MIYENKFCNPLKGTTFRGFGCTRANTGKTTTKSGSIIDYYLGSPTFLDINATNSATMEKILMSHFIFLQETINKQGEEVRTTNPAIMEKWFMSHLISLQETINKQGEEIKRLLKENVKL